MMWKETEYYPKRDDDSAIGDSANNSAGEESTNSRRKSSTSDDIDDMQTVSHTPLTAKLGTKVPECLLKDSDESLVNCKRLYHSTTNNTSKSKRVIRVLPASAILTKKSPERSKSVVKDESNTTVLEAKLQYLLFEMRKLRELDRDIFRKFSEVNDSVEEMRWKISENEANLKRNMAEVDCDVGDDLMGFSDSRISELEDSDFARKLEDEEEDLKFIVPVTKASTSYASLTYVKSSKKAAMTSPTKHAHSSSPKVLQHQTSSEHADSSAKEPISPYYTNPTYNYVDGRGKFAQTIEKSQSPAVATIELEKLNQNNYYRFKSPHLSPATSISSCRDDSSIQNRSPAPPRGVTRSQSTKSASQIVKKYSERIQKQQQQQIARNNRSNSSFRMVVDKNSRIGRRSHWPIVEEEQKISKFEKNRDYCNLVGLSKVRGHLSRSNSSANPRDSTESRNSSASLTSSASSSSSSITSPPRNSVTRSNSSKWSRLGFGGKSSKHQSSSNNPKNDTVIFNNNYKDDVAKQRSTKPKPRDRDVITVPYKHSQSDNVYNWIQTQDDVTFL